MNYCEYFANAARDVFSDCVVYSNVDPSREWNGAPTLEFNEPEDPQTRGLLSGGAMTTRGIYMIARAATPGAAEALSARLRAFAASVASSASVYSWSIEDAGTAADARGIVEGESFYGYLKINLTERT